MKLTLVVSTFKMLVDIILEERVGDKVMDYQSIRS